MACLQDCVETLLLAGEPREAEACLLDFEARFPETMRPALRACAAITYAHLGQKEQAAAWLDTLSKRDKSAVAHHARACVAALDGAPKKTVKHHIDSARKADREAALLERDPLFSPYR